ncbi:hypothetical protein Mgra_00005446 [Meloidogyne graminicola]|uniref:Lipoprotein n=1 Tax=Meloidogyne graminicola TaxID=189291 RepID=A0A8S9ZPN3_9BILA|nr:hypothetical protein Mgra_00005446 [Meloidogyne graminicola]
MIRTEVFIFFFIFSLFIGSCIQAKFKKQFVNSPQEAQIKYTDVNPSEPEQIKMQKPKSLKALVDYGLCKQECKRKRDQESTGQYVQWLREELKYAEEQLRSKENEQQSGNI